MRRINTVKNTFSHLFLVLVILLIVLPFWTTFNEFLTRIVENTVFYSLVQRFMVPYEISLVRNILSIFGIVSLPGQTVFSVVKSGIAEQIYISWNCVGWQSFIILLISLKVGFQGNFTRTSLLEALTISILGTFIMNLLRISLVVITFYFFGRLPAVIVHDYGSMFITIAWLFLFWWFAYSFVLETKNV